MFEDNGWEVPTIYDEFLTLAGEIKDKDIVPLAMDGGDGWPMAVYLSDILFKLTGSDYSDVVSNAISPMRTSKKQQNFSKKVPMQDFS